MSIIEFLTRELIRRIDAQQEAGERAELPPAQPRAPISIAGDLGGDPIDWKKWPKRPPKKHERHA